MCGCGKSGLRIERGAPAQSWEWDWYAMGAINQQTATGPADYRAPARTVADPGSYPERSEFHTVELIPGDVEIIDTIDPGDNPFDLESHVSGPVNDITSFVERNPLFALGVAGASLYLLWRKDKKR